jgi:16S rRNA (cytidine1402-2'-O)-methyltransferase
MSDFYKENIFRENVVFGSLPIGNILDISINMVEHIKKADIILVESHREFARLLSGIHLFPVTRALDLNTNAVIYQYDLHSDIEHTNEINNILLEKSKNNRILVVSDEGSSLFLEPGCIFKSRLIENNIPFQVISGPNSAITSVTNTNRNVSEFYFGSSLAGVPVDQRDTVFEKIKNINVPAVFLLTAVDAKPCIEQIHKFFGDSWTGDLSMNLTMSTEKHIEGSFSDILKYIDDNANYFAIDEEHKKFAIVIFPDRYETPHTNQLIYDKEIQVSH